MPALRVGAGAADDLAALQARLAHGGFAYARVPVDDVERSVALQSIGFRVIDTALVFDAAAENVTASSDGVRFARPEDRDAVADIAGTSFRYSRFHLDPAIVGSVADAIKREWAGNFFAGKRGDAMIVAEIGGRVAGFLQVVLSADGAVIDLIATAKGFERRGVARRMIGFLARNGEGGGAPQRLIVGTQAANTASCRLYENSGFRLARADFTLHFRKP